MTRQALGAWCDGVVETGWLVAAAVLPLYFNPLTDKVFEPDKALLLRLAAAVMALAWLASKAISLQRPPARPASLRSLAVGAGVLAAVQLVSAAISILPESAFWGSAERTQGAATGLATLAILVFAADGLRTRGQVRRLLLSTVLPSIPIALFAIAQALGLDPFPWARNFSGRVSTTLGNPIFAGAYFSTVFFFTLGAWFFTACPQAASAGLSRGGSGLRATLAAAGALQVAGVVLAGSRGPLLGLAAGAFCFAAFGFAAVGKRRWAAILPAFAVVATAVAGLLLFSPAGGNSFLSRGRQLLEPREGTGRVRVVLWQESVRRFFASRPLNVGGQPDSRYAWRPWLGYGPEVQREALAPLYDPEMARLEERDVLPDRAHNGTWDLLLTTGWVGLGAFLFLLADLFARGLATLSGRPSTGKGRLLAMSLDKGVYLALGGGALFGGIVPWAAGRPEWLGAFVPVGLVLAALVLLPFFGAPDPSLGEDGPLRRSVRLTAAALLGGIVAHLAENQFGIAIIPNQLLFALAGAALAAMPALTADAPAPVPAKGASEKRPRPIRPASLPSRIFSGGGLLAGLALVGVLYPFLALSVQAATPVGDPTLVSVCLLASAFVAALTLMPEAFRDTGGGGPGWTALGASLTLAAFGGVWTLAGPTVPTATDPAAVFATTRAGANFILVFLIFVGLLGAMVALGLASGKAVLAPPCRPASRPGRRLAALALIPALLAAGWLGLRETARVRADTFFRRAAAYHSQKEYGVAAAFCLAAARISPRTDAHWHWLGKNLLEKGIKMAAVGVPAGTGGQVDARSAVFSSLDDPLALAGLGVEETLALAREALLRARGMNPGLPHHPLQLGRLYALLAGLEADPGKKAALSRRAETHFGEAALACPAAASLYVHWGTFRFQRLNDRAGAERLARRAIALDAGYSYGHLLLSEVQLARNDFPGAGRSAAAALQCAPEDIKALDTLAYAASQQGDRDTAISATRRILDLSPDNPMAWNMHKNIALLSWEKGDRDTALVEISRALETVPEGLRPQLEAVQAQYRAAVAGKP